MTDWVKRPDIDSEADEDTVVWLAVRQLQREVAALKVKAAPTPVEDEVTEAMLREGESKAFEYAANMATERQKVRAIYVAMRAARVPTPTPEPSELVDQDAAMEALQKEYVALRSEMYGVQSDLRGKVKENAELRARCERLAAVVRAVSTALAPYDLHTIYTSQTPRITNAEASRIGDAIDALHPGDTEEAK